MDLVQLHRLLYVLGLLLSFLAETVELLEKFLIFLEVGLELVDGALGYLVELIFLLAHWGHSLGDQFLLLLGSSLFLFFVLHLVVFAGRLGLGLLFLALP